MGFFRWIAKQPAGALRFVARHGRTKMGRLAMSVIATTVADKAGIAPGLVEQLPDVAAAVLCNPVAAAVGMFAMLHRDGELKNRFSHN